MWKQFHRRVSHGVHEFFNTHLPNAVSKGNDFLGNFLNVAKGGHRLLTHVHEQVGKSELFTPEQKGRVAKTHAFAGAGLQKMSDLTGQVQKLSSGLASFRI